VSLSISSTGCIEFASRGLVVFRQHRPSHTRGIPCTCSNSTRNRKRPLEWAACQPPSHRRPAASCTCVRDVRWPRQFLLGHPLVVILEILTHLVMSVVPPGAAEAFAARSHGRQRSQARPLRPENTESVTPTQLLPRGGGIRSFFVSGVPGTGILTLFAGS